LGDSGSIQTKPGVEALLTAYAAGALSEPFAVLVASHLQMKNYNRDDARSISTRQRSPPRPISGADPMDALMPLALRSYVSRHLGAPEWRRILPGIKQCRIARDANGDASFLRCRPGATIPAHTHEGFEAVLVLQGGFRDAKRHYVTGDIALADHTVDHRLLADRDVECIIFIVLGGPVKLTGPFGRIIQRIFGR
jgi:putative transcriptional regulator